MRIIHNPKREVIKIIAIIAVFFVFMIALMKAGDALTQEIKSTPPTCQCE